MIPLKEEPTINAALCFNEEDAQTLLRARQRSPTQAMSS